MSPCKDLPTKQLGYSHYRLEFLMLAAVSCPGTSKSGGQIQPCPYLAMACLELQEQQQRCRLLWGAITLFSRQWLFPEDCLHHSTAGQHRHRVHLSLRKPWLPAGSRAELCALLRHGGLSSPSWRLAWYGQHLLRTWCCLQWHLPQGNAPHSIGGLLAQYLA